MLFLLLCGLPLLNFAQDSLNRGFCSFHNRTFSHDDNLCNDNPWIMVFEDDFIGCGLDKSIWDTRLDGSHLRVGGAPEQQYYTEEGNYEVEGGRLAIVAKEENPPFEKKAIEWKPDAEILIDGIPNKREFKYTSCNVASKRKFIFGKFETNVKLPKGKGFWPAFWLYGGKFNNVERYNELDIFEFWNEKNIGGNFDPDKLSKVHIMTSHFESAGQQCANSENYGIDFSTGFNVFDVDWDRNKIAWYVNGDRKYKKNKLRWGRCEVKNGNTYDTDITQPEDPMAMILNLAVQGNKNNTIDIPDIDTPFPSKMQVDWVRVWYRMNPKDTIITKPTQCILHEELFNVVTGVNIAFDCGYIVPDGQQLSLSASGDVILKSGFVAEAGSVFNVRSVQPIYDDKSDKGGADDENYTDELADYITDNQFERDDISADGFHLSTKGSYSFSNGLYVYPNPNRGVFRIQLPLSDLGKCVVLITDTNGHLVFSSEANTAENIVIDISTMPKGIYLLRVMSLCSEYNNFQKIVML